MKRKSPKGSFFFIFQSPKADIAGNPRMIQFACYSRINKPHLFIMRFQNVLDTVSTWCMLLVFGLLPFFFLPAPWFSVFESKSALAAILLIIGAISWIIARLIEGTLRVPALFAFGAIALLPLAYFVSSIIAGYTSLSLFGSGVEQDTFASACLWFAAFVIAAVSFAARPALSISGVRAFILGIFVLQILQLIHLLVPSLSFGGALIGQAGNAFGSWHDFAIILGGAAFITAALSRTQTAAGLWKYLFGTVFWLSIGILIIANFRDVWIALGLISALYLVYARMVPQVAAVLDTDSASSTQRVLESRQGKWIALIVASVFFALLGSYVVNVLPERLRVTSIEVRPSWQGTMEISQQSLTGPMKFFFGAGPNTFTSEWGLYKPAEINATQFWNTEFPTGVGSIPTSFITVGLVGLLAWVATLAAVAWLAYLVLFRARSTDSPYILLARVFAFITVFLFTYYVVYVPGVSLSMLSFLSFGLLAGLAAIVGAIPLRTLSLRSGGLTVVAVRTLCVLVFAVAVSYSVFGVGRVLASDATLNRGVLAYNASSDLAAASAQVSKAIRLAPGNDRAQRAAVQLGLIQLQQLISSASADDEAAKTRLQEALSSTIQYGLNAVSVNNGGYQNWLELAALYQQLAGANVEGAYDNARSAYVRAFEGNPKNPLPLLQLAQLELLQKRSAEALQYLAAAIELKVDFAPAYYLASQIYAAQNDFENAGQAASLAVKYAQNDPLAWYNLGIISYAAKNYPEAEAALKQAIVRQPQYANALYMLGLALAQQDKNEEALKTFAELDKLNPDQPEVLEIIANLRAGRPAISQTQSSR